MDANTRRQDARRKAREARSGMDETRKAREKRLEDATVTVLMSLVEVDEAECRAGEALHLMVEVEGLGLREALAWCNDEVTVRQALRLKRLVGDQGDGSQEGVEEGSGEESGDAAGGTAAADTARDSAGARAGDSDIEDGAGSTPKVAGASRRVVA